MRAGCNVKNNYIKMQLFGAFLLLFTFSSGAFAYLSGKDLLKLPYGPADDRIAYGSAPRQFGDLRIPKGKAGPYPVVVVIHGGCWLSRIKLDYMSAVSDALTKRGYATWNIEYRAADSAGGGWPGTFQDIGAAVDFLQTLAPKYHLDLNRVILLGHSAGGYFALWAASRHKLPKDSVIASNNMLRVRGIINLAGPGDLRRYIPIGEWACQNNSIFKLLLGQTPEKQNERLAQASPYELLPIGVKQIVIIGDNDKGVPPILGQDYVDHAQKLGDEAIFMKALDAGHNEAVAPGTHVWPMVEMSVDALLKNP